MLTNRLRTFLDEAHVPYQTLQHDLTYTAQDTAQSAHLPAKEVAKTVVVRIDGKLAMAVVPSCDKVVIDRLRERLGAGEVELATEREFAAEFPECDLGAMPPFGNLYGMDVVVDARLAEDDEIAFNAGDHTELVMMAYEDFQRLVGPRVLRFSSGHGH